MFVFKVYWVSICHIAYCVKQLVTVMANEEVDGIPVFYMCIRMYADDMVIFSKYSKGLHRLTSTLTALNRA